MIKRLEKEGYYPIEGTPGLWKNDTQPITFALCVENFGVKYFNYQDVDHLLTSLQKYYEILIDWDCKDYCGLNLEWHYNDRYIDVSMPGYVVCMLAKYQHLAPEKPQHAPHKWNTPAYGIKFQIAPDPNTSKKLTKKEKKKSFNIR